MRLHCFDTGTLHSPSQLQQLDARPGITLDIRGLSQQVARSRWRPLAPSYHNNAHDSCATNVEIWIETGERNEIPDSCTVSIVSKTHAG